MHSYATCQLSRESTSLFVQWAPCHLLTPFVHSVYSWRWDGPNKEFRPVDNSSYSVWSLESNSQYITAPGYPGNLMECVFASSPICRSSSSKVWKFFSESSVWGQAFGLLVFSPLPAKLRCAHSEFLLIQAGCSQDPLVLIQVLSCPRWVLPMHSHSMHTEWII